MSSDNVNPEEPNKSLAEQLGIKSGDIVTIAYPPGDYPAEFGPLPSDVTLVDMVDSKTSELDFIHAFYKERHQMRDEFSSLMAVLNKEGMLWISWPKAGRDIPSDISEADVRDIGIELDMIADEAISINEDWMALKFVYRQQTD